MTDSYYDRGPGTPGSVDSIPMSNGYDDDYGDYDTINVVVRVRPPTTGEVGRKDAQATQFPGEGQISVEDQAGQPKLFTFNVVFEPEAKQEEVFDYCGIKGLIDMALDGFACTVMAYGQTGSGKTHTLSGSQSTGSSNGTRPSPGIITLAFAYVYDQIQQRKSTTDYVVQASYLEVYNEHVLDLLNPSPKALPVRWSKDKGFYAENLFVVECEDMGDLEGVLEEGRKNRSVRSHTMNEHSSRSHTILVLAFNSEVKDNDEPGNFIRRQGKLSLVDLAGSEKTKKTNSKGEVLIQANNINKSLLVLGNCISCLADPKKRNGHIPFRDSILTKLLADSLSGSGMALMIACVSPSRFNAPETLNTLRYASRAKKIKTKPVVRMDPRELLILSLKREVRLLRMENGFLRQQVQVGGGGSASTIKQKLRAFNGESSPETNSEDDKDISGVIKNYMEENTSLREENANLHQMRELLVRDHELVCRENEKLLRRLAEIDSIGSTLLQAPPANQIQDDPENPNLKFKLFTNLLNLIMHGAAGHSPSQLQYLRESPSLRYLNNVSPVSMTDSLSTLSSSSSNNNMFTKVPPPTFKEVQDKGAGFVPELKQSLNNSVTIRKPFQRSPNGSVEIRRANRSLSDIPSKIEADPEIVTSRLHSIGPHQSAPPAPQGSGTKIGLMPQRSSLRRTNSWGSGIPLSKDRLASRSRIPGPAAKGDNGSSSHLPPLNKRNNSTRIPVINGKGL